MRMHEVTTQLFDLEETGVISTGENERRNQGNEDDIIDCMSKPLPHGYFFQALVTCYRQSCLIESYDTFRTGRMFLKTSSSLFNDHRQSASHNHVNILRLVRERLHSLPSIRLLLYHRWHCCRKK
jgi:hypothetical protein